MFGNGMNYGNMFQSSFNPYGAASKVGLLGSIKRFNWAGLLTNTQKTLGIINQAIPVFYQIKPIWNNAKTMIRVAGALRDDKNDTVTNNTSTSATSTTTKSNVNNSSYNDNKPIFFV